MFLDDMGGGPSIFYILKSATNPKQEASRMGFWFDDSGTDKHFQGHFGCNGLSCDPYEYIFNGIKVSNTGLNFFLFGTLNTSLNDPSTENLPIAI